MTIAEDGYSVRVITFDPRAFVLHKLWLSQRPDRDAVKRKRDLSQAKIVKQIAEKYLNLDFQKSDVRALPKKLRDLFPSVS